MLAATDNDQHVLATICAAYVEVNDYAADEYPHLRRRMRLILTEPALLAHSQLRYADVDRVVAEHVAVRTGARPEGLIPRLLARCTRLPRSARSRHGSPIHALHADSPA